jgi:hypothetical protein
MGKKLSTLIPLANMILTASLIVNAMIMINLLSIDTFISPIFEFRTLTMFKRRSLISIK